MDTVLFSLAETIAGTLLGSLIAVWAGNRSPKLITYLLAFASGVMMALVCFDTISDKMIDGNEKKAV